MTISLRTVTDKIITPEGVGPWQSVEELKSMIRNKERISANQQIIEFGGTLLENGKALSEYGIDENTILQLFRLPGTFVCKMHIV